MNAKEIHKLTGEEIDTELDRLRRKIFDLRTQAATEKIEDPSAFRKTRKDVARLMTERTARLRAAASGAPEAPVKKPTRSRKAASV
jgi:ribosomal protein L29